jgi:twinkle protein
VAESFADHGIIVPPYARGNVKVTCPQCSGERRNSRDKCLSVDVESGIWRCHHCEWTGCLKQDRPQPIRKTALVVKPEPPAAPRIGERGIGWFAGRGVPADVVNRFGIYTEPHWFAGADAELPALCFPYWIGGELVNVKYRAASAKHFTMVKDARKTFYNLDAVRDEATVVCVEGEMDVLALAAAGVRNAISVPNGANSLTDEVMDSARFLLDKPEVRFLLAGDADEKGDDLTRELARRFGHERCSLVAWPDGCKDANDTLMRDGTDAVRAAVEAAVPYPVKGIILAVEVADAVWTLYADGMARGTRTGWTALDEYYSVRPGELTVVTGIPGSGKSALTDNLAVNLARGQEWRIGVYSPENQPIARHVSTLIAKYVRAPFAEGPTPRMGADEVDAGLAWVNEHFAFILPEEPTVDAVLERARILVYRMGIRGLIIDPWNEMDHNRPQGLTETEYISRSLTQIRQFARQNQVHVWIVAHPTKLIKGADGQYPVPSPYDISGSAHWYNKADNAISVWRDKTNPGLPSDIHVQKIRFSEIGHIGVAQLRYDPASGSFSDTERPVAAAWRGGEVA